MAHGQDSRWGAAALAAHDVCVLEERGDLGPTYDQRVKDFERETSWNRGGKTVYQLPNGDHEFSLAHAIVYWNRYYLDIFGKGR